MKTRLIFSIVMLATLASMLFTVTAHAQYARYYTPYYAPYRYIAPVPYFYGYGAYGPFHAGVRSETGSGINFRFDGIPEAWLQVIEGSNLYVTGKKVSGCKGAAGNFSSKNRKYLALPPGTYDVEIKLPKSSIKIQNVSVGKREVVTLALPISTAAAAALQSPSPRQPYPGSRIAPIPNTQPMPQ